MPHYLEGRDDKALEMLVERSERAPNLSQQQQENLYEAKRILAERSARRIAPHFDLPRALNYLKMVARERRLCSYKDVALACINNPDADWATYYRKIGGENGLMQSIIRHCAANNLPHFSSLVVRQNEVEAGPDVPPNRDGELEYGFKRGMVDEGLESQTVDTDAMVLAHRQACFSWAAKLGD
jgi:hypothetical protein